MGYGHAVVAGGSIAGMAAAQALASTFDSVTLLERDDYPHPGDILRRGVPQARHAHVLLEGGQLALEQLFPGLDDDLRQAGAHYLGEPEQLLMLNARGWCTRFPAQNHIYSLSRELLDHVVCQRLIANSNVKTVGGCTVTGLLPDATGVRGVRLTREDGSTGESEADLVVDATGRNTHLPQWLTQLGYPAPAETRIDASLAYASRRYRIPADFDADWKALYVLAQPPKNHRMGALFPLEDNRWIVSLGGAGGGRDRPPTDEAGFLEFARSLRSPVIYDAIRQAEPLSEITGYLRTANCRRHYEKLRRWPRRLIVLGDAACAFNPIYGQGMAVAARTAFAVHRALRDSSPAQPRFARDVQRMVARGGDAAWLIATGEDLRYPTTTGASVGPVTKLTHRWLDRVVSAANRDPVVSAAFFKVTGLLAKPASLFRPAVAWRALRFGRPTRTTIAGAPTTAPASR
jgi:2-polyprenyl-6-methoxyphenol hydroxylase-like FAD-dependent oxidoreductase